jgi:hypothetical protein
MINQRKLRKNDPDLWKKLEEAYKKTWEDKENRYILDGFYDGLEPDYKKHFQSVLYNAGFYTFVNKHYEEQNAVNQEQEQEGCRKEH